MRRATATLLPRQPLIPHTLPPSPAGPTSSALRPPAEVSTLRCHYSVPGTVRLRGIKNDIEDSVLTVRVLEKRSALSAKEVCFTKVPLKVRAADAAEP